MTSTNVSADRKRRYVVLAILLVLWAAVITFLAVVVIPDAYWYSYYAVDYTVGFVRRGLAGEFIHLVPANDYFTQQRVGRWLSSLVFVSALAVLAWWLAFKSDRSERRWQLAFLVAVLPFGFALGMLSGGTTLFGSLPFVVFAIALTKADSDCAVYVASAVYGVVTAVATLVHEAIPFLFALGVILALMVLTNQRDRGALWISCALALGPGLVTALVVAVLGRHGVSSELCALVPHGQVNNPLAGHLTPGQMIRGVHYYDDYHDWACRNITPFYDRDFAAGLRYVGRLGAAGMIVNTIFGAAIAVVTTLVIGWVSGVSFASVAELLRRRWLLVAFGVCLVLPVFMTGVDWVRWWVMITFDIGVVYLLYARNQAAVDTPPTAFSRRVFVVTMIALALIPVGIIPAFLAPLPI
ncbi:hypothetical protein BOH72_08150 [Mycobacterium sp. WY10]|nr:hypothetical protein BOH72_08150 [Mycobacterium sp. WY10]